MDTDTDKYGIVFGADFIYGNIFSDAAVQNKRHALSPDQLDFMIEHIFWQAVFGYSPSQHSARSGQRLVNRDCKTAIGKVAGKSKSRRAGTNYRYLLSIRGGSLFLRERKLAGLDHFHLFVGSESFEQPDGHRTIEVLAGAGILARMRADASANSRERIAPPDHLDRFEIFFFLDKLDVTLNIDICRASSLAGCVTPLENTENIRNRLGIVLGDDFSCSHVAVERIGDIYRAGLSTFTTGIALLLVYISWMYLHRRLEVAWLAPQIGHFRECQDLNIQISRALDELWRDDARSTITGRERLVEPCHHSPDGGRTFDEIDFETGVGQIKRCLDAGNTAALN